MFLCVCVCVCVCVSVFCACVRISLLRPTVNYHVRGSDPCVCVGVCVYAMYVFVCRRVCMYVCVRVWGEGGLGNLVSYKYQMIIILVFNAISTIIQH